MILSETQVAVREGVRAFAQDRIRPNSVHYEREAKYPDELFEELGSLGLFGLIAPAAYGEAVCVGNGRICRIRRDPDAWRLWLP